MDIQVLAHWDGLAQVFTVMGGVLTFGTAVLAWAARKHAKAASNFGKSVEDAVNHRHRHAGNPPTLYDIALENRARLNKSEQHQDLVFKELDSLKSHIREHAQQTEEQRYHEVVELIERLHLLAGQLEEPS